MKLLILTQTLDSDDPTLGFFHTWVERFAAKVEKVTVICLGSGMYALPDNVEVYSLGKERGVGKLGRLLRFYWFAWKTRHDYDAVFVHMNPEYVVLGGVFWRLMGKKVMLWYAHRSVDLKLRLAERLAQVVTTTARESFRLPSKKLVVLGHGIDTEALREQSPDFAKPLVITHVGRITKIKHIDLVLRATRELIDRYVAVEAVELVGEAVTLEDKGYKTLLEGLTKTLGLEGVVRWVGGVKSAEMASVYARASLTINAAPEGGMDKTVLESLAASRPAFASNPAFRQVYGVYWPQFSFAEGLAPALADTIEDFLALPESERRTALRTLAERVGSEYDIGVLIAKILEHLR